MIKPGSRLRNGATILAARTKGKDTIVLADWPRNGDREFITWVVDNEGNAVHGNYFRVYERAQIDFARR